MTDNTKKFFLGGLVVVSFVGYSLHQRHEGIKLVLPKSVGSSAPGSTGGSAPATNSTGSTSTTTPASSSYKDGQYTGNEEDAYYGYVKVQVTIQGGKITDVQFLEHPDSASNSIAINQQAMPLLQQEAIQAQSANVDIISGATDTSQAFIQSLSSALNQAQS